MIHFLSECVLQSKAIFARLWGTDHVLKGLKFCLPDSTVIHWDQTLSVTISVIHSVLHIAGHTDLPSQSMAKGKARPANWRKISRAGTTLGSAGSPRERAVAFQEQADLCSDSFCHWVISPPAQLPEPTSSPLLPPDIRLGKHREGDAFIWGWLPCYLPPNSPTHSFFSCSVVSYDDWLAQWVCVGINEVITESPPTWMLVSLAHSKHIHDSLSYKCMLLFGQGNWESHS